MEIKTGIDAEEIDRIRHLMEGDRFLRKILGDQEYAYYESKGFPPQSVTGAWCAKEAFSKALGTGFRDFALNEVQILHDELGKPYFRFSEKIQQKLDEEQWKLDLSITHTNTLAMAVVVALKEESN